MKRASKFTIPPNWKVLFNDLGISLHEVMAHAGLPQQLFEQNKVQLTPSQYFDLWHGIEAVSNNDEMPLKVAKVISLESCDVPIYAALCSTDLNAALARLRDYKPLIGPLTLDIKQDVSATTLTLGCYGHKGELPKTLNLVEMIFFTQLARLATRERIPALKVVLPLLPKSLAKYEAFFGCEICQGEHAQISFSARDAATPFLTDNQAMLALFDGELQKKLDAIQSDDSLSEKVAAVLVGSLPQGESSADFVAKHMAMSKRTLQRKLASENQSFQSVLQNVRQELAAHYLTQTSLPMQEVSFLLGFHEYNSFVRAYNSWTGCSPSQMRSTANH